MARKRTSDAIEILRRRFVEGRPDRLMELAQERTNANLARKLVALRTKAGLSQRELAKRVGTTASVICRLEDADYDSHSLPLLRRIAAALQNRIEIRFVPVGKSA